MRHVPHESIGTLERYLGDARLGVELVDCFAPTWPQVERAGFDPSRLAGLVVMGGPMNVDQVDKYPFLATEARWLRQAVDAGLPTLGVCLGAQLLAKSLGSRVYANPVKEIGWYEIELLPEAGDDRLFAARRPQETVFQWHGDTFDLPAGAVQLARGAGCQQQAFRYGPAAYALQFHVEMTAEMIDDWLNEPEMCCELAAAPYIDVENIRRRAADSLRAMAPLAESVLGGFAQLCKRQ
jgi:GMP synthase (glutamine-hydrolysing)